MLPPVLSIVVPAYNEERNIPAFLAEITRVLEAMGETYEIVFVNDGSRDGTMGMLAAAAASDPRIKAISLARNFGKDVALSAGLAHASGQATIPIDCDLQHPPELIPAMVAKWREGFEMVLGVRSNRDEESLVRRTLSRVYYKVMGYMTSIEIPPSAGDFRLLDRKILTVINSMPERHRFLKGIFAWPGFRVASLEFQANPRANQTRSTWSFFKLWRFALDGLFSFSAAPLKLWTYVGALSAMGAFIYAVITIVQKLFWGIAAPGYASLLIVLLFFNGLLLISNGIQGEYIARIFEEVKGRPMYVIAHKIGFELPCLKGMHMVNDKQTPSVSHGDFSTSSEFDPLLSPWTGPHGGFPRFDAVQIVNIKPALLKAMELNRAEIAAIVASREAATFENTIAALEDAGRPFRRVTSVFYVYRGSMSDKVVQGLEEEMAPVLAAFGDEIIQNAALFARIKAVYERRTQAGLAADQVRLVETLYREFARNGAELNEEGKTRLKDINGQLASLYTKFSQNLLAEEEAGLLVLDGEQDLAGLPSSLIQAAKQAGESKRQPGKWVIANTRSAIEPFLTFSTRRDLREKAWRMWVSRGDNGNLHDNNAIIKDILGLREHKAKLLGYQNYAQWVTADNMAKTPDAAMALCMKVWKAAVARVTEEVAAMQQLASVDELKSIEPWDYRFYAEKVRKARFDLDANEVKQYFQLDKMREAMMWAAEQLYGLTFTQVTDVPVVHPDVTVYEVTREGAHVGLWYFDPYARDGKESGAWMSEYRTQERFKDTISPIVSNNSNFVRGEGSVLISWDDAQTLFHEFGHALHGLNSNVRYPSLAGTNTKRDFVEFPSQLNEHWLRTPEILNRFAVHHQTGKPMPQELVAKLERAKHFNEGFRTVEYLAAAIYDLKIHTTPVADVNLREFERNTMAEIGMPAEVAMRHRPTQFAHVFAGDGYSAGYYSYLWADTLTADAAEAFKEAGSFYDKATAQRLHDSVLSVGNSIPPDEAFRQFRGRDPDSDALMRSRGFPVTG